MTEESKRLDIAGRLAEEMRGISDLLKGAVTTLTAEGWTEEQARQVVIAMYVKQLRA